MSTKLNVSKLSFNQIINQMFKKGKKRFAQQFLDEQDILAILHDEARNQVVEIRVTTRDIGARKRALADPDTKTLEPLERLQARRKKMIEVAGKLLKLKQALEKAAEKTVDEDGMVEISKSLINLAAKANLKVAEKVTATWLQRKARGYQKHIDQASAEIASLDKGELGMMEETYATLEEAYDLALQNLQQAEAILHQVEVEAPGIMAAIKAYQEAQELKDSARDADDKGVNAFMTSLSEQMAQARSGHSAELQIDKDLAAMETPTFAESMDQFGTEETNAGILSEITASSKE